MIVGDRFDTDVRAGVLAGIKSCLLESGAHTLEMADEFPTDLPSYTLQDISGMLPVTTLSLDDFDPDTDLLSRSDFDSATSPDFDYSPAQP